MNKKAKQQQISKIRASYSNHLDDDDTYPMDREAETHNLPACSVAAEFWDDETSHRASSNCKSKYVPVSLEFGEKN